MEPQGNIIKAAIKIDDKIYVDWRHSKIRDRLIRETDLSRLSISRLMGDEECDGFITENGVFLTRKEAFEYGRKIGQVGRLIGSVLTSEDLWDGEGHLYTRV